jgi:hypothetical protein
MFQCLILIIAYNSQFHHYFTLLSGSLAIVVSSKVIKFILCYVTMVTSFKASFEKDVPIHTLIKQWRSLNFIFSQFSFQQKAEISYLCCHNVYNLTSVCWTSWPVFTKYKWSSHSHRCHCLQQLITKWRTRKFVERNRR